MPRRPIPALGLGLAALALALASGPAPSAHAADEAPKASAKAAPHAGVPAHAAHTGVAGMIEEHEAPGEPDILEPQPSLAIFTVVVFLGLMLVLGRFAWKPLLAALHQREEHLEHVLHEAERARNESESLLAEHQRRLASTEDQIRGMIEEARKNATAAADEIIKRAQAEAESSRTRAEREIGTARDQALSEIWTKTADLAVSVAGKVLSRSFSEDEQRRLIDVAVNELPAAPVATNGHGELRI